MLYCMCTTHLTYQPCPIKLLTLLPEPIPAPRNIRTSEVSMEGFRVSWQRAADDVMFYKLSWRPTAGGEKKQVCDVIRKAVMGNISVPWWNTCLSHDRIPA